MTDPQPPAFPFDRDRDDADATLDPTREVDGEEKLDPEVNDDLVESAEADRLASGADDS